MPQIFKRTQASTGSLKETRFFYALYFLLRHAKFATKLLMPSTVLKFCIVALSTEDSYK